MRGLSCRLHRVDLGSEQTLVCRTCQVSTENEMADWTIKEQKFYAQILLKPTCIYVKPVLALLETIRVKGMAHMTGGAWYEKLTKVLPKGLCFSVNKGSWPVPRIFGLVRDKGRIPEHEMYRTFNMGIGFCLVVDPQDVPGVQSFLRLHKVESFVIGEVVQDPKHKVIFK